MVCYFDFDSSNGILRCRLEGDVTDESLKECYEVARKYVGLTNPSVGIMDFSNVVSFSVSPQTVRDLAYLAPVMPGPAFWWRHPPTYTAWRGCFSNTEVRRVRRCT